MTEEKRCNRCGRCCLVLPLFTQHMHPEFKKYLLTRGLKEDKEQGCILIPHVCQHLITTFTCFGDEKAVHSCDIHDSEDRPEICRKFKGQKIMKHARIYIPPGCAFRRDN